MTTKYIEVDSSYRDRSIWPLPSNFQILLSQSASADAQSATDPVTSAMPITEWQSNRFQANSSGSSSISGTVISTGFGATNNEYVVIISAPAGQLQQLTNYYAHTVLTAPGNVQSRVSDFQYLGNNKAKLTVSEPVSLPSGTTVTLTDPTDLSVSRVFVPSSPGLENFYAKKILYDETVHAGATITGYDAVTGTVTVATPISGWSPTDSFDIRDSFPVLTGTVTAGTNSTTIGLGPNSLTNLVGSFIRFEPTYPSSSPAGSVQRIISYDPVTFMATVYPAFSAIVPPSTIFEILPFTKDNANPFVFVGTRQQDFIIYEITLLNLTLPNIALNSGYGGTIKNYPYVYVQLTPMNTVNNNIISSNNPNSNFMLFRATKCHAVENDSFVQFSGNGMSQRVKFKTETDLHFSVLLPNGQFFETAQLDTVSPSMPNGLIQISAIFEIRRD